MSFRKHLLPSIWMACLLGLCVQARAVQSAATEAHGLDAEVVTLNNRAVGLMGHFEYHQAEAIFSGLAASHPALADLQVTHAIAVLNRQMEGDEQRALAIVDGVLSRNPAHPRAHYVAGLLRLYQGAPEKAAVHFRLVADKDSGDGFAAYYLAQCLAQQSQFELALQAYETAIARTPYLRSAYYGAFQAAQRLRDQVKARTFLNEYQRLARNPRALLAEFRYTRMGPKAEALAFDLPRPGAPPTTEGPVFAERLMLPAFPTR